jgi:CBS domain containing-hemolysin-like protein
MTDDSTVPASPKPVDPSSIGLFDRIMTLVGLKHAPSIREDIEDALAEADIGAEFSQRERDMLKNVLGLRANRVQDVMVPRADIVAVAADISLGELLRLFRTAGHSRLPVYAETLDDPRGMIHIRDFVAYISERAERKPGSRRRRSAADIPDLESLDLSITLSAAKILRPVLFVPPPMIQSSVDGTYVVDARADLKDVSQVIGIDLSQGENAEEIDTIGGLVGMLAGRVPVRGQIIPGPGTLEFEVLDADPRRVKRVRIQQKAVEQKDRAVNKRRRKTQAVESAPESLPEADKA